MNTAPRLLPRITEAKNNENLTLVIPGFPQTFDNWIQGLFKDFEGEQQRIYFKARPPLNLLLAVRSFICGTSHVYVKIHILPGMGPVGPMSWY